MQPQTKFRLKSIAQNTAIFVGGVVGGVGGLILVVLYYARGYN